MQFTKHVLISDWRMLCQKILDSSNKVHDNEGHVNAEYETAAVLVSHSAKDKFAAAYQFLLLHHPAHLPRTLALRSKCKLQ